MNSNIKQVPGIIENNMSTFTDDDLKQLKECLNGTNKYGISCRGECADLSSLLARLEAAEKLIVACGQDINISKQYEAWRKSKGE